MTTRGKIEIAIGVILLAIAGLGFSSWIEEHDARIQAAATAKSKDQVIAANTSQIKAMQDADAARDKQASTQVVKIEQTAAAQKSSAQIIEWAPKQIPNLPAPIAVSEPASTAANPTPNAIASIPQADLPTIRDDIAKCQICSVELADAQADVASEKTQLTKAGQDLSAMTNERDAYKNALKGGTFFQRLKHNSKIIAIAVPAGAIAVCALGHCK